MAQTWQELWVSSWSGSGQRVIPPPAWRDIEANGLPLRVRSFDGGRRSRGQVQVALQRGDTFLQLFSDQLGEERLVELAAEFEPYAPASDL